MVEHGLGISMLSELILDGRQDEVRILPIVPESVRNLAVSVKPDKVLSIPLKRLIAITKDFAKEYTERSQCHTV
jgi:DNA-binding transcriptional LysR family regulator